MQNENDCWKMITGLVILWLLTCGYFIYFAPKHNVDVDCLLDYAENLDIIELQKNTIGRAVVHEDYTLKQARSFYTQKYPKSRFMAKQAINLVLGECSQ